MAEPTQGLPKMTQAQQAGVDSARANGLTSNAAVPKTSNNPTMPEKQEYWDRMNAQSTQPNVSTSQLRPQTVSEAAKINEARAEAGVTAETPPALLPNPNATAVAAEAPKPTMPASEAPQPEVAPNLGLNQAEKDVIQNAMGGMVDTMGGMWEKIQELYKGVSKTPFTFDQYRGEQVPPQGAAMPGAEASPDRVTTPIGFDQGIPQQAATPSVPNAPAPTKTQEAAQVKPTADNLMTSGTQAPAPMSGLLSPGAKAAENILLDPVASTHIEPGEDPYTANVRELTKQLMDGQLSKDQSIDRIISIMEQRKESMAQGQLEAEDRIIRDAKDLTERMTKEKETAVAQTQYEINRGTRDREKNIDQMEQDNSRLFGFMQRRLAKMGNTDSSYAIAQISKYTSLASSQLADARVELSDYRSMMVSKEQEIAYKFGNQLIDIANKSNDAIQMSRRETRDQMLQIESQVASSEIQKTDQRNQLLMQLTEMENQAKSTAFQETQQVKQTALQEAQFTWGQLMDMKQNEQWQLSFEEQTRQFNTGQTFAEDQFRTQETGTLYFGGKEAIDPRTKQPIKTIAGKTYDQQIDQWLTDSTGYLYRNGANTGSATWARDSFGQQMAFSREGLALDRAQYMTGASGDVYDPVTGQRTGQRSLAASSEDLAQEKARIDLAITKINAGISDPSTLNQFKSAFDVMAGGTYVGKNSFADVAAQAMQTAAKFANDPGFQCVQFARAIVKDLPTGLFSLADKVNTLLKGPNAISKNAMPNTGDVIVLDWKTSGQAGLGSDQYPGHVAVVGQVDQEKGKALILQHNVPAGKTSSQWVDLNSSAIKGYWRSPSIKQQAASPEMDRANEMAAMIPAENQRNAFMSTVQNLAQRGGTEVSRFMNKTSFSNLGETTKSKIRENNGAMSDFGVALQSARAAKESDAGLYTQFLNDNRKWVDIAKDERYQDLASDVFIPVNKLMNTMYGASLTPEEMKRAGLALPLETDKPATIIQKIEKIQDHLRRQQRSLSPYTEEGYKLNNNGFVVMQDSAGNQQEFDPSEAAELEALGYIPVY